MEKSTKVVTFSIAESFYINVFLKKLRILLGLILINIWEKLS